MDWWWRGAAGAIKHKHETEDNPSRYQNVALIVGVTGMSGNSLADMLQMSGTPGGRWKVYGVACRPQPEWQFHQRINYVQCEMGDPEDSKIKLSRLTDVTHVFYVGWVNKSSEAESCLENGKMLRNVLKAVIPNAPNLQHVCLQTGLAPSLDVPIENPKQPKVSEDLPKGDDLDCYYGMENILFEEIQNRKNLTWSVHRPAVMFGFSPYSTRNIVGSLCVYATICKHGKKPLRFPGIRKAWDGYSEGADADLVADQQIWAALEHPGKGQAFNCSNGDVFKWCDLWKVLAEEFEVEFMEFEECSDTLEEMMRDKGRVWEEIIEERELLPTKLEEIGTWWYVDYVLRREPGLRSAISCTMKKSKEFGFEGCRDTAESFRFWIDHTRKYKIVP
ncbi:hypothetical protein vseg_016092 [Gypsophila vaccaria]